jgi:hypothetical protein
MSDRIRVTEADLRAAMRDGRCRQARHPERQARGGRGSDGFHALLGPDFGSEEGAKAGAVRVRPCSRTRDGHVEREDMPRP